LVSVVTVPVVGVRVVALAADQEAEVLEVVAQEGVDPAVVGWRLNS
jgi:hypothetical protein